MLLLSRPRPNKLESLRGYILRLTQTNGYHTNRYILEMAGLWTGRNYDTASNYVLGNASLAKLSKITNVPMKRLQALRYGLNKQKESIIHNHKIANDQLRLDYPRICPLCLDTNNIALAVWDIPAITVCPEHHIPLFDHCPECDIRLRWNRPEVHLCHYCECDFREYTNDKVRLEEYCLSRLIHQLCMNNPIPTRSIPKPLRNHSFGEVLELTSSMALLDYQMTEEFLNNNRFLSLKTAPNELLHTHYSNAMRHLDNWPDNFHHFLTECRQTRQKRGVAYGISKEIGAPFYLIKANRHKAIFKPLWDAYDDYREKTTQQTLKEIRQARIEAKFIPIRTAARELQIRPEQLLKYCKRLKIRLRRGHGSQKLIAREKMGELNSLFDRLLTIHQVAEQLGVTVYQLRKMIHKEVIVPFRGPTIDKSRDWYFEPQPIEILQKNIRKRCYTSGFHKTHKLSLKQALEQITYYKLGLSELVIAILDGRLKPSITGKDTKLGKLKFSLDEIKALRPKSILSSEYWQPPEIQKYLGCKKHVVFGLLKRGQLLLEKINLPGRTRPVFACRKKSVTRFKKQFILLSEITSKSGFTTKEAKLFLASKNVEPLSGPTIDGGYCYLYKRNKSVEKLLKSIYTSH